jgi:type II secretory pathway component PulC
VKEREMVFVALLAVALAILGVLSLRVIEKLNTPASFAQEGTGSQPVFSLPKSGEAPKEQEVFLAPLNEEEIAGLRDVFSFAYPQAPEGPGETIPVSEGSPEELLATPEETPPSITLKGVVLSPTKQVVVVEVNGEIFFLTPEKPLSGELQLVKVDRKQVVLTYQGREFTFPLEK